MKGQGNDARTVEVRAVMERGVRLGLSLGYWGTRPPVAVRELVTAAEALGYDSMWTAEAYGSDALSPLAWLGSTTTRMRLGTSIMQMAARPPTATGMAALTMDHLSGGRFMLGLGASGPQVVEGWYGQPYPRPLERTREYISVVRDVLARRAIEIEGAHYQIPYRGGTGLGKPLRSIVHPLRSDLPVLLAAEGEKNVALAAEVADGWIPHMYSPYKDEFYRDALDRGFRARGAGGERTGGEIAPFEVPCMVRVEIDDDVEAAAARVKPMIALYVGGMGAKNANFHLNAVARLGFADDCERIQDLYLAGNKQAAIDAVPTSLVEMVALVGPWAKIREELSAWSRSLVTLMLVDGPPATLELLAEAVG